MKKIMLVVTLIVAGLPTLSLADSVEKFDPLYFCPQLYVQNPAYQGSVADCRKVWDYYVETNNYCGMALMTLNGEGGQKANLQMARKYASQLNADQSKEYNSDNEAGCTKGNLTTFLSGNPTHLTFLDIRGGVDAMHNINLLNYQLSFQIEMNVAQQKLNALSQKLPSDQAAALQTTWVKYKTILNAIDGVMPVDSCQLGTLDGLQYSTPAKEMLLKNFQDNINNIIENSPPLKEASQATLKELDKQLNLAFQNLQKKGNYYVVEGGSDTSKNLMAFQSAWIRYKNAYLHFAQLYYADDYKPKQITQAVRASLTQGQLKLLRSWLNAMNNFKSCH